MGPEKTTNMETVSVIVYFQNKSSTGVTQLKLVLFISDINILKYFKGQGPRVKVQGSRFKVLYFIFSVKILTSRNTSTLKLLRFRMAASSYAALGEK